MKIYTKKLNAEFLAKHFLNIGKPEKERNKENLDNVVATPSKHDHINLEKSYQTLRKSLLSVSGIVSKGGKVVVYHKNGFKVEKPLETLFTKVWPKGFISNFKSIGKNFRPVPNLVVVATETSDEQRIIANEVNRYKIASVFITNSNNPQNGTYNLLGNITSNTSTGLLINLFKRAITVGLLKEVAKLDPRKVRAKRYKNRKRAIKTTKSYN
jgi:ribosomal protein S2